MFNYAERQNLNNYKQGQWPDRVSDSDIALRLGIQNWSEKQKSYRKTLYSNNSYAYDDEAIYLVDKLEVTFLSNELYPLCTYGEKIRIGNITFEREPGKERYFYHHYKIYIENHLFGYLDLHSTAKSNIHKIEVTNESLYVLNKILILNIIFKIAKHFDFTFSNVSKYELARDTCVNYYDLFCNIFYQSDFCSKQIHEIYNSTPTYSFHGKRKMVMHHTDLKDNSLGTIKIGSKDSDSQVKIYCKSHELKTWKEEKIYINEIHRKYFSNADTICRVEAIANSKAFNKRELDLLDILLPDNHTRIFESLIGDKIRFKNLNDYQWDLNNNKKYEVFELIDPTFYTKSSIASLKVKKNATTHNNQYKKFKILVHEYLDEEIGISGVISFMRCNIWNSPISKTKYHKELRYAIGNHKRIVSIKQKQKVRVLFKLLDGNGKWFQIIKIKLSLLLR